MSSSLLRDSISMSTSTTTTWVSHTPIAFKIDSKGDIVTSGTAATAAKAGEQYLCIAGEQSGIYIDKNKAQQASGGDVSFGLVIKTKDKFTHQYRITSANEYIKQTLRTAKGNMRMTMLARVCIALAFQFLLAGMFPSLYLYLLLRDSLSIFTS